MRTTNRYDFEDKVVLITGAGSGIGQAIARAFLDHGASVAIVGRRVEKLAETSQGYDSAKTLAIGADLSEPDAAADVVRQTLDRFGQLDVFINNAAQFIATPFTEMTPEEWTGIRSVNVDAFVSLAQAVLPELEKTRGNVVVVGSVSGLRGDWGQSAYNATKALIMNLVQSLALDYGPSGVRLNSVAPAFTVTPITEAVAEDEDLLAQFTNRVALGRPGTPEDIAPAVLFLASADAGYITGATLAVDGGTTASTGQPHLA